MNRLTPFRDPRWTARLVALAVAVSSLAAFSRARAATPNLKFEISFSTSAHNKPITGRVYVMLANEQEPEPRLQVGSWGSHPPFFGVDVSRLRPGQPAVIDESTLGFPTRSLRDVPAGDYYVQALVNVYSEFHRSDGHSIWAHMDRWEGQQFNSSPGNLYSKVERVHLDPATGFDIKLSLTQVIPPVEVPNDTAWVKHIKIQSKLLSRFWGCPIYFGAVVLLPRGYDSHPESYYPVIYQQGHFDLEPAFGFSTHDEDISGHVQNTLRSYNIETGYQFYKAWNSDDFPRMIAVTFQHPTPFFDDSYAVNSANNGPYGDALMTELIPYVETHFRIIRKSYARVLTGGSTGGWESLALQVLHPDFFGGTWTLYPDPVDFTHDQLIDIYNDDSAFFAPGRRWLRAVRPLSRETDGQVTTTVQQESQLEDVLGSHGRSGQQFEAWEAVYGPAGAGGYPKPLWDKRTGKIDHSVANYMRDHGYDLTEYLRRNWSKIGASLVDKIHIDVGDMDTYYLNLACYDLEKFLEGTTNPYYDGEFKYGRPEKGHGWQSTTQENMVRIMADHVADNAPADAHLNEWHYN
ncbi:MAG TPA: alpha/beta hydrolase-fold protein [Candidatus Angelobacter sp.]|nr:alpha/beta hydrolase-fold protein [Candidatus Angelobacter sp.]